ncbi:MAG: AAA domain-containing protein [Candidatus Loosdrechtia sp.]|uniref:AAA domain-containing protein n=1 Tax=Candidatus Loosdrechtia sp. TaxID=3101272 RepID=UPI003A650FD5|nr:MAG: AAA domain-containing protein [Candidatus Jettenia sp. AMX2]
MSLKDKVYRLFEYISHVYSIDLPVDHDVTKYDSELWWQAEITPSSQCKIKEFNSWANTTDQNEQKEIPEEDIWLSVIKRKYEDPPELPAILKKWVTVSSNPTVKPSRKPSVLKIVHFNDDKERLPAFKKYVKLWEKSKMTNSTPPEIPTILIGWVDMTHHKDILPVLIPKHEIEEKFDDNGARQTAYKEYVEGEWKSWTERVLPFYKAGVLYDDLFSLHQRLSVEGDRIEIVWGHVFLSWEHSMGNIVYYPLMLTPVNLVFSSEQRTITLSPSQTIPTKLDLDCLLNLDYPFKDELLRYCRDVNNSEIPPEVWNHNQIYGLASTITGYLCKEAAEKTNLYTDKPVARPAVNSYPAIYNAPVLFVRKRSVRLWIDDAKKIAESIYQGAEVPPFIRTLVADLQNHELPNPEEYADSDKNSEDENEDLLPLEYNGQQKEIADKLRKHFGVLVQGPPGTGKSHTIANIVSSLLARGNRVLVTSQTENALRVLRNYIPESIRSLCVSQLGNDADSRKQLNEAVDSIGKHLAEKNSLLVEQKIQSLRKELRAIREEKAEIECQIKNWAKIDSETLLIDGKEISAYHAAKECSVNEAEHAWFPDKITYSTEPPLTQSELLELCSLIHTISPADRKSCLQYLPAPEKLLSPEVYSQKIQELKSLISLSAETKNARQEWGYRLRHARPNDIQAAIEFLEKALSDLQKLAEVWQIKILDFIAEEEWHDKLWRDCFHKCISFREAARDAYKSMHGHEITFSIKSLPAELNIDASFEELRKVIEKGKNPSHWMTRMGLSKPTKLLFDTIKVDGHRLMTSERIIVAQSYLSYVKLLKKIYVTWNLTITTTIDGPDIDIKSSMPLAHIDDLIRQFRWVIEWKDFYLEKIKNVLLPLGCPEQSFHRESDIRKYLKMLYGQSAIIEKYKVDLQLDEYGNSLISESRKKDAHDLWKQLADAIKLRSAENYEQLYREILRLLQLKEEVQRLEFLANKLKDTAPYWLDKLEREALATGTQALPKDWTIAWRWQRLNSWLRNLHNREDVDVLQDRLERARRKEHELITELVATLTWKRQLMKVKDHHYRALTAWTEAMRKYGKGTGKHAYRFLRAATKAMIDAVGAVPVWIMPLHRVVQSFQAEPNIFDVVIVDEASQCDLRALSVLFRAQKVLVVGDPEQISPSYVGVEREKIFELLRQFIADILYSETTFAIDNNLYNITQSIPRMKRTLLTEHFRSVPEIIEFNNHLCPSYGGKLEPLRQPNPQERLEPSIRTIFVENGFKNDNDINEPEAQLLVEMLVKCCQNEKYSRGGKNNRKRTMGVISLLGEKQAKYISGLLAQRIEETEREDRGIICGDAYAFQGDERDIMFLSLVIAPNTPFTSLTKESDRQRFNVATSRARDQVFLFHSVRLEDIKNQECMRHKLLSWYLNPPVTKMETGVELLKQKAENEFEIEVGERIIRKGFNVIPQYRPFPSDFNYRIDLVIQGEKNRVAVKCDGNPSYDSEKWEYDQRREAQLRRAGWKFWRISGSAFYRNKEKALEGLWKFLETEGIANSTSR